MTWAQGTFAYCFGILVPAVGIVTGRKRRREAKSWFLGFVLGSGTTFIAFVACCVIAHWCFPQYPNKQISELLANAFTLPIVVAGIAAVWLVSSRPPQPKRFCYNASALLLALYLVGLGLCHYLFTWGFRQALPWSARDVHEAYWTDSLLPDYTYQLKARITEQQFREYISKFHLTPHTPTRTYSDDSPCLSWGNVQVSKADWWDPSKSLESTFVWQGGHTWTFAKYERGYLYLGSLDH